MEEIKLLIQFTPEDIDREMKELAIDNDISAFTQFFEVNMKQAQVTAVERAFLKTFLMWKALGPDAMIK